MFAINHAATALILKKKYDEVPIVWLLISVQFMELFWVLFNFLGIEVTTTENTVRYVGDIHLSYMPFSHSVLTMTVMAILAWFVISKLFKKPVIGIAVGIGIFSHLVLDLLTHSGDIQIMPGLNAPKLGLGLYASLPALAFAFELLYGAFCWWFYKGSRWLLATILVFNLANISMFITSIQGPESLMAHQPDLITGVILIQIVVTLLLVGFLSKGKNTDTSVAEGLEMSS